MSIANSSPEASLLPWETAPARYWELLAKKCATVQASFAPFDVPEATIVASPQEEYRARAEFRIWHDGDDLDYVMFDPAKPRIPVCINDFPPALSPIRKLLSPLRDALRENLRLRRKLFQIEFMASTTGELLVTLVYHRALDEDWLAAAEQLAERFGILIVGRSRKQKLVLSRDYICERVELSGKQFSYRQYEQAFAQPNAPVNTQMLAWACEQAASLSPDAKQDLLELYCGNGNFTLPLSQYFNTVIATELSKSGTRAAGENLLANAIDNVSVVRLSA
ncbi:MAG: tRNA (uracil-5-)-methyltransferase, partial [Halieaceae bacterium]